MRSILTLTFSFALITAYLEWIAPAANQQAGATQLSQIVRSQAAPITRNNSALAAAGGIGERPIVKKAIRALNLSLPSDNLLGSPELNQPSQLVLEEDTSKKIRYNAELVYDLEKGEDITGGKVNIEIPFG